MDLFFVYFRFFQTNNTIFNKSMLKISIKYTDAGIRTHNLSKMSHLQ